VKKNIKYLKKILKTVIIKYKNYQKKIKVVKNLNIENLNIENLNIENLNIAKLNLNKENNVNYIIFYYIV